MSVDRNELRLVLSLTIAQDDVVWEAGSGGAVTATLTLAYCDEGIRCDGELNLRISLDE